MALQEVKCDVCGDNLMYDDWDGQYYQEDYHGLWNKIVVLYEDDGILICDDVCYSDKSVLDYFKIRASDNNEDILYQAYKEGEL